MTKVELRFVDATRNHAPGFVAQALTVAVVTDAAIVEKNLNPKVLERVAEVELAKTVDKAMDGYEAGDALGALQGLKKRVRQLEQQNTRSIRSEAFAEKLREATDRQVAVSRVSRAAPAARVMVKVGRGSGYSSTK